MRPMRVVTAAVLVVGAAACSSDDSADEPQPAVTGTPQGAPTGADPQPLTDAQAERFAAVRFNNYRGETGVFEATIPTGTSEIELHGVVDWRRHVGSAVIRGDDVDDGLVQWNFEAVIDHAGGDVDGLPPPPEADGQWTPRAIDPSTSTLDTILLLLLNLASDRPENPQLLRQGGAGFIESTTLDGAEVDVFAGPDSSGEETSSTSGDTPGDSRTRYWIDADGALRRFEARLGSADDWAVIDFDVAQHPGLEPIPDLLPRETTAPPEPDDTATTISPPDTSEPPDTATTALVPSMPGS